MAGMMGKFVAGAAQTGADILKADRLAKTEAEGRASFAELQARLQGDLQARQNEFLASQGELTRQATAEQASMTRQSNENARLAEMGQRESAAQRAEEAEQRRHAERMAALDKAAKAAEKKGETTDYALGMDETGNLLRGKWDPTTGELKAGDKVLKPHQPKDSKTYIDRAKAYFEAGDIQSGLKVLDDMARANGGAGGVAINDPLKPAPAGGPMAGPPSPADAEKAAKKRALVAARNALQKYGLKQRKEDPAGYQAALQAYRDAAGIKAPAVEGAPVEPTAEELEAAQAPAIRTSRP